MFAYSLTGLEITDDATGGVLEVEESEITARSAVYQVLGQLFAVPDAEFAGKSGSGQWGADFTEAVELLAFDWEIGEAPTDGDLGEEALREQYEHLFLAEHNGVRRIWGGAYVADREQNLVELRRAYEYYGLGTGNDDVPYDHLTAEVDFMQFLAFKEAAASSPRLGKSFRRAQVDFLDRQLGDWLPQFTEAVRGSDPTPLYAWAIDRLESFVAADAKWLAG
jgi:DMSO reductase family type II enzyme chaperone